MYGLARLSWDLIQDCTMDMQLLDSFVGVFVLTSLGALFIVASVFYW